MPKAKNYRLSDLVIIISSFVSLGFICQLILIQTGLRDNNSLPEKKSDILEHLSDSIQFNSETLNNTRKCRQDLLLVIQLYRSGSSTIEKILKYLKDKNNFLIIKNSPRLQPVVHFENIQEQKRIANKIISVNETSAILTPLAYLDFQSFGLKPPTVVSVIRQPIERAISIFYHQRAPQYVVERLKKFPDFKLPDLKYLKKDLGNCIKDYDDNECSYTSNKTRKGHTVGPFCGHDNFCRLFGNIEGLNKAKANVEKAFAVVGILEEWNKTLAVLEAFVPKFFKNASSAFYENIEEDPIKMNRNKFKPLVDVWVKRKLEERLHLEMDFYAFARQRLHHQYLSLQKNTLQ